MLSDKDDKSLSLNEAGLNEEVEWGRTYRKQRQQIRRASVAPTASPFNIQRLWEQYQMSKELREIKELKRKLHAKPIPVTGLPKGRVDPDTVTKKVYYNYMSTPIHRPEPPPLPIKPKHKKEECSPRLIYLALPNKVRILHNWKDFRYTLPIDSILRLEELLHKNHNLDPKFARCYFKKLDRLKRKQRNKLKKRCREKRKRQQQECKKWLKLQIKITTDLLVKFLKKEPLFSLNFKQMLLSEAILTALHERGDIKTIPPRNSSKPYSRSVVDIVDQLSVWVDTIVRYVDVQYTESIEKIIDISSMGSMSEEGEGEEGEDESDDDDDKKRKPYKHPPLPPLPELPSLPGMPGLPGDIVCPEGLDSSIYGASTIQQLMAEVGEGYGTSTEDMSVADDALESLIEILSYTPANELQQLINPDALPNITYQDILSRLQNLKDQKQIKTKKDRKSALEKAMIDWAKLNQPDQVDQRIVGKIQYAAGLLSECLEAKEMQAAGRKQRGITTKASTSGESTYGLEHTASGDISSASSIGDTSEGAGGGRPLETLLEEGPSGETITQMGEQSSAWPINTKDLSKSKLAGPVASSSSSRSATPVSPSGSSIPRGAPVTTSGISLKGGTPEAMSRASLPSSQPVGSKISLRKPTTASGASLPSGATPITASGDALVSGEAIVSSAASLPSAISPAAVEKGELRPEGAITASKGELHPGEAIGVSKGELRPGEAIGVSKGELRPGKAIGVSKGELRPGEALTPSEALLHPERVPGAPRPSLPPGEPAPPRKPTIPSAAPLTPSKALLQPEALTTTPEGRVPSRKPSGKPLMGVIPGHKPSKVFEHQPDTICCLTLKVWATWLLEVAHNAHAWSRWLNDIINEVRRIASVIRGEVKDEDGNPVVFYKEDWIEFSEKVDNMITSWRQYSMHVKDLTDKIVHNFRGMTVTCCPKCLEDNLIVDVALAHNISQQLAEAMNTAGYWRRWLDSVVMETKRLTGAALTDNESQASSYGTMEVVEIHGAHAAESEESLYEIEELDPNDELY